MSDRVEEPLTIPRADLELVRRISVAHGVEVEELEEKALEPLLTVTILLIGGSAAILTVQRIFEEQRGGQVIDLRPGAPEMMYRSRGLNYGLILIKTSSGRVLIKQIDTNSSYTEFLNAVVRVANASRTKSPHALKKAIQDALPGDEVTSATPTTEGDDLD